MLLVTTFIALISSSFIAFTAACDFNVYDLQAFCKVFFNIFVRALLTFNTNYMLLYLQVLNVDGSGGTVVLVALDLTFLLFTW